MASITSNTQAADRSALYHGQTSAHKSFETHWFPKYSPEYVKSQEGFTGALIQCYSHLYNGISSIDAGIKEFAAMAAKVGNFAVGWAKQPLSEFSYAAVGQYIEKIRDFVCPLNPINGQRHFVFVPRSVEKFIGDYIYYPLNTWGLTETSELLNGTHESIAQRVNSVLQRLSQNNQDLLNPNTETTAFDYRVKTVLSSDLNAFAVPAGGMVVFSQLVKELQGAIISQEIREARVDFADGSSVNVNLTNVTLDDALAALMGHEMTHVASRHSMVSIFVGLINSLLLSLGRVCLIYGLQSLDKEFQELKSKPKSQLSGSEQAQLQSREALYDKLNQLLEWVQMRLKFLDEMFRSRSHEYEADTTGAYFTEKAGMNPLGAIYLQEFLAKKSSMGFFHKYLEFLFSHPCAENRKRGVFAAIAEFSPQSLQGRLSQWNFADNTAYDPESLSPAFKYPREIAATLRNY